MSGLGKLFLKKTDQKWKINVKMPHVNKKQLARKQIFGQFPAEKMRAAINKISESDNIDVLTPLLKNLRFSK